MYGKNKLSGTMVDAKVAMVEDFRHVSHKYNGWAEKM